MPLLVVKDQFFSDSRLGLLKKKMGEDKAIGQLLKFCRVAAEYESRGADVPSDVFDLHRLSEHLIEVGFGERLTTGVKALNLDVILKSFEKRGRFNSQSSTAEDETSDDTGTCDPSSKIKKLDNSSGAQLMKLWNDHRGSLPMANALSHNRMTKARKRLKEQPDLEQWIAAIKRIAASSFCQGNNDRSWIATFDWILRPDVFIKISEGMYDNRGGQNSPNNTPFKVDNLEEFKRRIDAGESR